MAYLRQIDIENFKSWGGKQVIGPFMRYNAIIGMNGSGKSNIMDAVGFAIGERPSSLRAEHLQDLIHSSYAGMPVARTASVALRCWDDQGRETVFRRTITGNSSEYWINGDRTSLAKYIQLLKRIGIVPKIRNCLVFQGAVESLAMTHPKDLTKLFESISRSGELAAEYDEKLQALEVAKRDTEFHFNRNKYAIMEKRQLHVEKTRAEDYYRLMERLNENRLHLSLAELYFNEKSISDIKGNLHERRLAAAAVNNEVINLELKVKTHKREDGHLSRQQQQLEREICVQEKMLSQYKSKYIKSKVNVSYHMKKAEELKATLTKAQKQMATKEQMLNEGREEIAELERIWREYFKHVQEQDASRGRDIELEEEQLHQYNDLKELARKQSAVLSQQIDKLYWEARADQDQVTLYQRRKQDAEVCIRNNQTQLEDLICRAEKLQAYASTCRSSLEEYRKREETLRGELEWSSQRSKEVNKELGDVLEELNNACLYTHESQRRQRRKEVLEMLRRVFPDSVYGYLSDLCSPIHKKYQLAVTKVFGCYMNAIVVSTEKAARECIAAIKQERAEPEIFLPIDYLDVRPLNERLREVRGAKLMVDVIQVNVPSAATHLSGVVQFVCGSTLVCETIIEAKRVAFEGPVRIQTVSLDGTLFAKSGMISGGCAELRNKARCWEEKAVAELRERKDKLTAELRSLMKAKRKESEVTQIIAQAHGAETRLKYSNIELENIQKKNIQRCHMEISRLKTELTNIESHIQMHVQSLEMKDINMKQIRERVQQMEDLVFADFCAEIRVDNIREYERVTLTHQEEFNKKRLEYESQCARLNVHLEFEQDQLRKHREKYEKIQENISKEERAITQLKKEEEKLLSVVDEAQSQVQELKNQLLLKRSKVSNSKAELDHLTRSFQEIKRELVNLQRQIVSAESTLEQRCLARHNLLLGCKVQDIPVCFLSGSLDEIGEIHLESQSQDTSITMSIYEREQLLVIDYSCLQPELENMKNEAETHLTRLRESVSSAEEELLHTIMPNFKAVEKMKTLEDKLKEMKKACDSSRKMARKCNQDFQQVKSQRHRLFTQCFDHVCVTIDQMYKQICRNSSAQAILSAENAEEPYLGGIIYNCVAPGKCFMSMNNLSGGEKTVAALTLLFAIHSFRPAPFLIMDEVDAALDNTNINKVTSFFREVSIENMQLIIISHKEQFFSSADALLGVYTEPNERKCSHILTLNLRPFPTNATDDSKTNNQTNQY